MSHSSLVSSMIITFLIYVALSQSSSCTDQCSSMKFYNCQICYQTCQLPLQSTVSNGTVSFSLQFRSCREQYCSRYESTSYSSGNDTRQQSYCAEYDWEVHNEDQCTQSCCNNPPYRQFTNQTFAQCVAANQDLHQSSKKITIIVGSVIGGAFFVAALIFLFFKYRENMKESFSKCFNSNGSSTSVKPQQNNTALENQINTTVESLKQDVECYDKYHKFGQGDEFK